VNHAGAGKDIVIGAGSHPITEVRGEPAYKVVVEWEDLKPCWVWWVGRDSWRNGRMALSRTFAAGHKREIGR